MTKKGYGKIGLQHSFYQRITEILERARKNVTLAVNTQMVHAYWLIGREIVEEEQKGKKRAGYGSELLKNLSEKLTADYGEGFDESNLRNIRHFYLTFPIRDALRHELSWTHYRILMRVENPNTRSFYEIECVKNNWSVRELERQKGSYRTKDEAETMNFLKIFECEIRFTSSCIV